MTDARTEAIRRRLDEELSLDAFERNRRSAEDAATRFFRDLFVEVLGFEETTSPLGDATWRDLPVHEWPDTARAIAAHLFAEAGNFRAVYVELEELTRAAERNAIRGLARSDRTSDWAVDGTFLAVFHAPDEDAWHLVTPYEDGTDDVTAGRPVLRRYALGEGETHRTVANALGDVGGSEARLAECVDEAFRFEPVTEEFYADYRSAFDILRDELRGKGLEIEAADRYAHATLDRLLFFYYLQKEGRIDDRKDFVRWFHERYEASDDAGEFHEKWLSALFFDGTNEPEGDPIEADLPSDVSEAVAGLPHVNVGLFRPTERDESEVFLSDTALRSVVREFLERYNFTITEESPYDVDVAVDPATLGKIHESLIAERERGEAGIFYTPRIEVDLMCRVSLYEQFCDRVDGLDGEDERRIVEFVFSEPRDWDPESTGEAETLEGILRDLRIVDPACGSGAFLVGMKRVLVELYRKLGVAPDYRLENRIVSENLYGVDVKDWAVRVAESRLWLSLVESEDDRSGEPVLPHSSFELECGDSIVQALDDEAAGRRGERLEELRPGPADASGDDAFRWERDFAEVMSNGGFDVVIGNPPYVRQEDIVDQRIGPERLERMDSEVVREEKERYKTRLRDYVEETFDIEPYKRSDLYLYFFFKGVDVLRPGGTLAFVTSNSWLDVNYGRRLQEGLLKLGRLEHVFDNRATRTFGEADVNTVVTVVNRAEERELSGDAEFTAFDRPYDEVLDGTAFEDVLVDAERDASPMDIDGERIRVRNAERFRAVLVSEPALWRLGDGTVESSGGDRDRPLPCGSYSEGGWGMFVRAPDVYFELLDDLGERFSNVGDVVDVRRGITSGANDFFYLPAPGEENGYFEGAFDRERGSLQLFVKDDETRSEFRSQGFAVEEPTFEIEHEYVMRESDLSGAAASDRFPFHYEDGGTVWVPNLLVKSPKEIDGLAVETGDATRLVLRASESESNLDPGVREYVEWGETWEPNRGSKFAERRTCAARTPWYDLGELTSADVLVPRRVWSAYSAARNRPHVFDNDALLGLEADDPERLWFVLNSSVAWLFLEINARSSLGQGVLDTDVNMLEELLVPDPSTLPDDVETEVDGGDPGLDGQLGAREPTGVELENVADPLRTVDDVVLSEGLGASDELRERIYRALVGMVDDRIEKSRGV